MVETAYWLDYSGILTTSSRNNLLQDHIAAPLCIDLVEVGRDLGHPYLCFGQRQLAIMILIGRCKALLDLLIPKLFGASARRNDRQNDKYRFAYFLIQLHLPAIPAETRTALATQSMASFWNASAELDSMRNFSPYMT